jgi:hypothetical protein
MNDDELRQRAFRALGIPDDGTLRTSQKAAPNVRFAYDGTRTLYVRIDRGDDPLAQEHGQRDSVLALPGELLDHESLKALSRFLNDLWLRSVAHGAADEVDGRE